MQITSVAVGSHEKVVRVFDASVGLIGFIAIHSTKLGPSAGGLRLRAYEAEADALKDVLRLSRGMTFKNAAAGLPLGGGKAVIMCDPRQKTPAMLRSFGQAVQALGGQYWTAEDMGVTPEDMAILAQKTDYVAGLNQGDFASGDPSPVTAQGIFNAIRTTARHRLGTTDLTGRTIAVQGLGHVGMYVCGLLRDAGAHVFVADVAQERVEEAHRRFQADRVPVAEILRVDADILAPCAIGGVLNAETISGLQVKAVAGGANNQLATEQDAERLHQRGILYAPDFVANGGGIINVATEILRIPNRKDWVADKLSSLDQNLDRLLSQAAQLNVSPNAVAEEIVGTVLNNRAA